MIFLDLKGPWHEICDLFFSDTRLKVFSNVTSNLRRYSTKLLRGVNDTAVTCTKINSQE
jgi:hypothetical protein